MAMKRNPSANSTGGGPNDSCWNMNGYNMAKAPPAWGKTANNWNTRYDQGSPGTFRATGWNNPFNPPVGMNTGKDIHGKVSNAPKGR